MMIHRALIKAETPAVKELSGLCRNDGKRPDGMTLVPWQSAHSATRDVTVVHTQAASYVSQSSIQAGSAAAATSDRKSVKYTSLCPSYLFFPVAVETLGTMAEEGHGSTRAIGRRVTFSSADTRETAFLLSADFCCSSEI